MAQVETQNQGKPSVSAKISVLTGVVSVIVISESGYVSIISKTGRISDASLVNGKIQESRREWLWRQNQ